MESSITDIVKIIKFENNVIAREKELMCYFFDLIRELMKLALEEVDAGLVEKLKIGEELAFGRHTALNI